MVILTQQINFLTQCRENMDKFNLYLSVGDKKISCEPSLALKNYYKWSLKYLYRSEIDEKEVENYFKKLIEKEDYKALIKLEYTDFKNLVVAYYSLGELYFHEKKLELSREYFDKAIDILQETLKSGNRYAHSLMIEKDDVSFFELMMWAKKNLADMNEEVVAIEEYEGIVSEGELLYLQKNYGIYLKAKEFNLSDKAYEAARNVLKVYPDYEGVNIDAVKFLKQCNDYYNALDIAINEYKRNEEDLWIELVKELCEKHEMFNIQCVEKVISFMDLLLWNLRLSQWGQLTVKLYEAINQWDIALNILVKYLKKAVGKINYKTSDFSHFPYCVDIVDKVFNHIKLHKYENRELRLYDFDFTFFLMNAAFNNKSYEAAFESATRLSFMLEENKEKNDIGKIISLYKEESLNNIILDKEKIKEYPWAYLQEKLDYSIEQYENQEKGISLKFNKKNSNTKVEGDLKASFNNFYNSTNESILGINTNMTKEEEIVSNKLKVMEEGIYESKTIETGITTDLKEFSEKIKNDLEFLREYAQNKMNIALPDLLEKNLNIIDELDDIKTMKSLSEDKFKEIIVKWCEENLKILLWEQFNVYLSKYKNIYLEHMEVIEAIEENRKSVAVVVEGFEEDVSPVVTKTAEEILETFKNHYNEFLDGMNYDISFLPQEKLMQNVAYTAKTLFKKTEDKVESLRSRIKATIIETKLDIISRLVEDIFKNLEQLCTGLQEEIQGLLEEIVKFTREDVEVIQQNYDKVNLYYQELKNSNEEMGTLLSFIEVELNKYKLQISHNIIYSNGKCYSVR